MNTGCDQLFQKKILARIIMVPTIPRFKTEALELVLSEVEVGSTDPSLAVVELS